MYEFGDVVLVPKTALFNPEELLRMDGIDELMKMKAEPNPFWNRPRLEVTWQLPVLSGFLEHEHIAVQPMRLATRKELLSYHDISYVETLELFGNTGTAFSSRFGFDTDECPVFQDVHKYASYPVGASIDAIMGVAEGKFRNSVSYYGGLHHAMETKASGFCYYNDCVVAIKQYQERFPGKRVLYLDTDAHHGDGTQAAFYSDPNVLTISMHELSMGFYPGTGRPEEIGVGEGKGYSVNIPLPPLTGDVEFWSTFEDVVIPIWLAYKPDLVFWDVGGDAHIKDPLADLMLTYDTYQRMATTIKQLTHIMKSGLVVVGGGGYDPVATAKIWMIVLSSMADIPLPPTPPLDWIRLCQGYGLEMKRGGWTDRPVRTEDEHYQKITRALDETVQKIKDLIFPVHGL